MFLTNNIISYRLKRASRLVLVGDTSMLMDFCRKQLPEDAELPSVECYASAIDAVTAMQRQPADFVVGTLYSLPLHEVERLTIFCANSATPLYAVPAHVSLVWNHVQLVPAKGGWTLTQRGETFDEWPSRLCRRMADFVLSLLLLLTVFPLVYVVVAVCIKRYGAGSVLVGIKRKDGMGRSYTARYFRTQHQTEDKPLAIGDYLQRTHLCELPQLLNVFVGQMSLVGPQLHLLQMEEEHALALRCFMARHRVKAGMTGWARVHQETRTNVETQRDAEMAYVREWTLWKYVLVLWRTILVMLLR